VGFIVYLGLIGIGVCSGAVTSLVMWKRATLSTTILGVVLGAIAGLGLTALSTFLAGGYLLQVGLWATLFGVTGATIASRRNYNRARTPDDLRPH
jgi:Na+/proline symporter